MQTGQRSWRPPTDIAFPRETQGSVAESDYRDLIHRRHRRQQNLAVDPKPPSPRVRRRDAPRNRVGQPVRRWATPSRECIPNVPLPTDPETSHVEVKMIVMVCVVVWSQYDVEGLAGPLVNIS
jgi:hypothetical protein